VLYNILYNIIDYLQYLFLIFFITSMQNILPYALSCVAGAMIYVVVEELIPEAQSNRHDGTYLEILGCIAGFAIMMFLDVALG
jgi:ZIP family zinc transporter